MRRWINRKLLLWSMCLAGAAFCDLVLFAIVTSVKGVTPPGAWAVTLSWPIGYAFVLVVTNAMIDMSQGHVELLGRAVTWWFRFLAHALLLLVPIIMNLVGIAWLVALLADVPLWK
jgi:hypothetical protein